MNCPFQLELEGHWKLVWVTIITLWYFFATKNDIDFSEIKKQILTKKTVKLKVLITWHKQRLAEGFHANVFEAFSFSREEAAGNCW